MAQMQWPAIGSETLPWDRDVDELQLLPKSARRKIRSTYDAAVPLKIAERTIVLLLLLRLGFRSSSFPLRGSMPSKLAVGYDLPALLLRSESSASSQIERLTSSVRNVALAELCDVLLKMRGSLLGTWLPCAKHLPRKAICLWI